MPVYEYTIKVQEIATSRLSCLVLACEVDFSVTDGDNLLSLVSVCLGDIVVIMMRDGVVMCVVVSIVDVGCLDGFLACWWNVIVIHTI
jgi:hypothetical protein